MQSIFFALQALHKSILVLSLMILISLSGLFIFAPTLSYAATTSDNQTLTEDEKVHLADPDTQTVEIREEACKKAVEDANDTDKAYKKANPEPNLLEKAEELIEKVTGKI